MVEQPVEVLGKAVKPVTNSLIQYLHLGEWLNQKVASYISGLPVFKFSSIADFWKAIIQEKVHSGSRVRFEEAFITEWIPRIPGAAWRRNDLLEKLQRGERDVAADGLLGETDDPFGVVRLPYGADKMNYAALSLTTIDSWYCDLGVPLLVSSSVYDAYVSKKSNRNAVVGDLEGILTFGQLPLLSTDFLSSIAGTIDTSFLKRMVTPIGLPYAYIRVVSPLDVKFRYHNSHPPGYLWVISREIRNAVVKHHSGLESGSQPWVERIPVDPYPIYAYLTVMTYLNNLEAIEACIEAFQSGSVSFEHDESFSFYVPKPRYRDDSILRVDILTEFDGLKPRFQPAAIPLSISPWHDQSVLHEINRALSDLQTAFSKYESKDL